MTPDAVVNYLKQHPEFFEEQADFLATIMIPPSASEMARC